MPSGSYKQVYVQCPFYQHDDGKMRITCEGIIDDSSLSLIYRHKSDYEIQVMEFCCKQYHMCEIYRLLIKKYEEEDGTCQKKS